MKTKGLIMMTEKVKVWLQTAPMPDFEAWLRSLYNDNILAVSRGGENIPAAFAEYGKKLMVDRILESKRLLKTETLKYFDVASGSELLGTLYPEEN
jgi:hypothetical protein